MSMSDKQVSSNLLQVTNPFQIPETRPKGFFESIRFMWTKLVNGFVDFITGDTCRFYTLLLVPSLDFIFQNDDNLTTD